MSSLSGGVKGNSAGKNKCGMSSWRTLVGSAITIALLLPPFCSFAPAANVKEPGGVPGVSLVEGKSAAVFLHYPVSAFRLYAFHEDAPQPIPFQVDERDQRDRWALEQGPKPNRDNLAGEFDENDVIIFMNRDLGARGELARLPSGAMAWGEVRVGSAVEPLGFVYIGVFPQSPPLPCADCTVAQYDEATDRVYAERYALAFHAPLPTHIAFVDKMGDFGVNVAAGVHATGEVRFLGGLVTLRKTDADIHAELLGYRNGPVRAIRRARYWIPLPFGFRTSGQVDLLFYRDFVEGTALVKIKIPPSLVLARGEVRAYFDFLQQTGARVLLEGETPSAPVNGRMTPEEQTLVGQPARWAALLLPSGRTVMLVVRLEGGLQRLEQRLYFDDAARAEGTLGGRPLFGFQFARVDRLTTGTHRLSVFACIIDSVDPEGMRETANVFLSPPEVVVSALTR